MDLSRTSTHRTHQVSRSRTSIQGAYRWWWIAFLVAGLVSPAARAHDFGFTDVLVVLKRNGSYLVDLTVDVDALALGVPDSVDSAEVKRTLIELDENALAACVARARDTVLRRVRIRVDGEKLTPTVVFPDYGTAIADRAPVPTLLGVTARLAGVVPEGASTFTIGASRAFKAVNLTVFEEQTGRVAKHVLSPSEDSPPFVLGDVTGGESVTRDTIGRYLVLGYEHILPLGLDHILFVLGLFLLSPKLKPLLWQITAFTVAHSVTLALSMYGVISLPPQLVESLIALSIAYVAIENLFTSELKPWRPPVVFAFGLLHGLGFAGVLMSLGLPRASFATALVAFNVGVESGQLSVVALAFLAVGWARKCRWYRSVIVIPASALIAIIGLYWCVERAVFGV